MNYKERKILHLLYQMLKVDYVENPCDIKGLAIFHNIAKEKVDFVRIVLDEITYLDIPKERLNDIIYELKEELQTQSKGG